MHCTLHLPYSKIFWRNWVYLMFMMILLELKLNFVICRSPTNYITHIDFLCKTFTAPPCNVHTHSHFCIFVFCRSLFCKCQDNFFISIVILNSFKFSEECKVHSRVPFPYCVCVLFSTKLVICLTQNFVLNIFWQGGRGRVQLL